MILVERAGQITALAAVPHRFDELFSMLRVSLPDCFTREIEHDGESRVDIEIVLCAGITADVRRCGVSVVIFKAGKKALICSGVISESVNQTAQLACCS